DATLGTDSTIDAGTGDDTVYGTPGDDDITAGDGSDTVDGNAGDDTITGGDGSDTIDGDTGNDTVTGDAGDDTINGGDGNDTLNGSAGDDSLIGGEGADNLNGGDGNDNLQGNSGNDNLFGLAGIDTLMAGPGNDKLDGGFGADLVDGGPNYNLCSSDFLDQDFSCSEIIELDLKTSTIQSGVVVDSSGNPVSGVCVYSESYSMGFHRTRTDSDFNLVVQDGAPGLSLESCGSSVSGFPHFWAFYAPESSKIKGDAVYRLVLPEIVRLKVHLQDTVGNPIAGANVWAQSGNTINRTIDLGSGPLESLFTSGRENYDTAFGGYTDSNGNYYIDSFGPGKYPVHLNISYTDSSGFTTFDSSKIIPAESLHRNCLFHGKSL
ncbi:MAG: calcium-binding protein, partial [Micrococcales bacterium]|nr:calcium-binding protein [Micrococcales bacterium]